MGAQTAFLWQTCHPHRETILHETEKSSYTQLHDDALTSRHRLHMQRDLWAALLQWHHHCGGIVTLPSVPSHVRAALTGEHRQGRGPCKAPADVFF